MKTMRLQTVVIFSLCLINLTLGVFSDPASKYIKNLISTCKAKQGKIFGKLHRRLHNVIRYTKSLVVHKSYNTHDQSPSTNSVLVTTIIVFNIKQSS